GRGSIGRSVGRRHRCGAVGCPRGGQGGPVVCPQGVRCGPLACCPGRRGFGRGRGGASSEHEGGGKRDGGGDDHIQSSRLGGMGHGVFLRKCSAGWGPGALGTAPILPGDQWAATRSCTPWTSAGCAATMGGARSTAAWL